MTAPASLLNLASTEFRGDVVNQIASGLGEEPSVTKAALGGAIPALIGGLANKVSTNQGATDLFDLLKTNHFDGSQPISAAGALGETNGMAHLVETGRPLLGSVFGGRANSVTQWLSSLAGIGTGKAMSLLSLATPIVLGLVGRQVRGSGWNVSSLKNILGGQKNALLSSAPPGLVDVLGTDREDYATPVRSRAVPEREPVRTGSSFWRWAIPLLLGLGLLWMFLSRRDRTAEVPRAVVSTPTVTPPRVDLGPMGAVALPNGVSLNIPANGVENRLIGFIKDPSQPVDASRAFSFDRLEFETGAATLQPGSQEQLRNIAEIMKAYPAVSLKIGGYTDNVGDPAQNLRLSQERATNTMNALVGLGVPASRLSAEGYGEQNAVGDNTTEEGRQRNRRIDISVTKK